MKRIKLRVLVAIAVAFLLPVKSFAAEKSAIKANIPQIYGKAKGVSQGTSDLTVIHIQDAHGNVEAQENIQNIIKSLAEQGKIDAISDEAGWNEYNTQSWEQFSQEDKEFLSDWYIKFGLQHGATRYKVLNDPKMPVIGAEEKETYVENLKNFRNSHGTKEENLAMAQKIKSIMEAMKLKIFDDETRSFLQNLEDFEEDKITLTSYARSLKEKADQAKVKWNTYQNFSKVITSIELEEKIDFAQIDRERLDMVDELESKVEKQINEEIVTKSLNYRLGRLSASEYYDFLLLQAKNAALDQNKYKNVYEYAKLVKIYSEIDDDTLFQETDRLVSEIKAQIFQNESQVKFDQFYKGLDLLTKMINLQMTRTDLASYRENKPSVGQMLAFLKDQSKQLSLPVEINDAFAKIDQSLTANEKFYEVALKRDEIMVEKTLAMMDERGFKTVVLVAGGFHTQGIIESLKGKSVNHVTVTPRITNPDAPNYWLQNMTGEETEATEELKKAGLSVSTYTINDTDKSTDTNPTLLANLRAAEKALAEEGAKDVQNKIADVLDNKSIDVDVSALSPSEAANAQAVIDAFKALGFKNIGFKEQSGLASSLFFDLGEGLKAPCLRKGNESVFLPRAMLSLSAANVQLLANQLALSEKAEVDNPNEFTFKTNLLQNSPMLHVLLAVLDQSAGLDANLINSRIDAAKAMFDTTTGQLNEAGKAVLNKNGFPSIDQLQSAAEFNPNLLVGAIENMAQHFTDAELQKAVYTGPIDQTNGVTVVGLDASLIDVDVVSGVTSFSKNAIDLKNLTQVGLNLRGLGDKSVIMSAASADNEQVKALIGLIHLQNGYSLQRDADGNLISEKVIAIDATASDLADQVAKAKQNKQHVILTGDAKDVINAANSLAPEGKTAHFAIQEGTLNAFGRSNKDIKQNLITYDAIAGINKALAVSAKLHENRPSAEIVDLINPIESKKGEATTAVEQFIANGTPLNYADYVTKITELMNQLANSNSAVAWMA